MAVDAQLAAMEARGLLSDTTLGICAIIRRLAAVIDREYKGYAVAQASAELRAALDSLPKPAAGNTWDMIAGVLATLSTGGAVAAPAAYATAPTEGAPHQADAVAAVAAVFGRPLMPWQLQAARILTERTDDGRRWRYKLVVITVPRQAGKTYLLGCLNTQRAITRAESHIWTTAQTGKDATARWGDLVKLVTSSQLAAFTTTRRAAGTAVLTFTPTGSTIAPFPPTETSLHGYTITDADVDEAFAFDEAEGAALMGAITPAMATVDDSQTVIISTAGTPESTWLKTLVDKGRRATQEKNADMAYLEWSSPDGAVDFHPALGHTITVESLDAAKAQLPAAEWRRAYLNQWVDDTEAPFIEPAQWAALVNDQQTPLEGAIIALAYEVAWDRSQASIVAAWEDPAGVHLRNIASGPGTDWLIPTILDTMADLGGRVTLVADDAADTRQVSDALAKQGIDVHRLGARDFTAACAGWRAHVQDGTLDWHGLDLVALQIGNVRTRPLGDGWAISRRHSTGPVDQLIAGAAALRVIDTTTNHPAPFIA